MGTPQSSMPRIKRDPPPKPAVDYDLAQSAAYRSTPKSTPKSTTKSQPKSSSKPSGRSMSSSQKAYCQSIIKDLYNKKTHAMYAAPFFDPVGERVQNFLLGSLLICSDYIALGLLDYPAVIKEPMDLSTINRKLTINAYSSPQDFADDFHLMLQNCFVYNQEGSPVYEAGQELKAYFKERWAHLPSGGSNGIDGGRSTLPSSDFASVPSPGRRLVHILFSANSTFSIQSHRKDNACGRS